MKIQNTKLQTTQKPNELLEVQKQNLKVNVLPPNYMEKLKASVAGLTAELNKPGMRESLIRDINKRQEEQKELEENLSRKELERERKAEAIDLLERWGLNSSGNIAKINAIKFEKDGILIGDTKRAYENMRGSSSRIGNYNQKTGERYFDFNERKIEAKNQGIDLPTKEDIKNTFAALRVVEGGGNAVLPVLHIILGQAETGYYAGDNFFETGKCLGSVSVENGENGNASAAWYLSLPVDMHTAAISSNLVCRPIIKKYSKP